MTDDFRRSETIIAEEILAFPWGNYGLDNVDELTSIDNPEVHEWAYALASDIIYELHRAERLK